MKKLLIILSLFISLNSFGQVFINSSGGIQPSGAYAGYYGTYIQGATKVVYDTIARNAIPTYYRDTLTFMVYTKLDSSYWILSGGTANSNFKKISQFSSVPPTATIKGSGSIGNIAYFNGTTQLGSTNNLSIDTPSWTTYYYIGKTTKNNYIPLSTDPSPPSTGVSFYSKTGNGFTEPYYIDSLGNSSRLSTVGASSKNTGTGISPLTPVCLDSTSSIAKAKGSNPRYAPFAISLDSIPNNGYGRIVYNGGIVSGLPLSIYNAGQNVYLGDNGGISPNPSTLYPAIKLGVVTSNTLGSMLVAIGNVPKDSINAATYLTGNSPTITSSKVPLTYWNGTNHVGYTNGVTVDTACGNVAANTFYSGFSNVAASGTQITLTVLSIPNYYITGSGGQVVQLPNATTLPNGCNFSFNNNQSSGAITVNNNSGTTVLSIPSGGYAYVVLVSNGSSAGTWDYHFSAPSAVSWSTNTFNLGAASITNASWNGSVIGSNKGGAGSVNGILKADGSGNVSAATAGTDYQAPISAGTDITIASNVVSADTTTGATKLATQGYVTRNSSSGGLTGTIAQGQIAYGAGSNKISGTANITVDTTNNQGLKIGTGTLTSTANPAYINLGGTYSNSAGNNLKLILNSAAGSMNSGFGLSAGSIDYSSYSAHSFYCNGTLSTTISSSGISMPSTATFGSSGSTLNLSGANGYQLVTTAGQVKVVIPTSLGDFSVQGNLNLNTTGDKIKIATGTNASVGTATFGTGGTVTLTNTCITSSSKVFIMLTTVGGTTYGVYQQSTTGTSSMVINSLTTLGAANTADTSTFNYWIIN
jgi:hypothetical protein